MNKKCATCKQLKPLGEFFAAPSDGSAKWSGTSEHCRQCHAEARVPHGYGAYGDKWASPETTGLEQPKDPWVVEYEQHESEFNQGVCDGTNR